MKYSTVLCDMGQVLIRFDPEKIIAHYTDDVQSGIILKKAVFDSQVWLDLDLGIITNEEAIALICEEVPSSLHALVRTIILTWPITLDQIEAMIPVIKAIKQKGPQLFLASNTSLMFHEFRSGIDALKAFDGVLISADIHQAKPDPAFFETILSRFDLDPSTCFLIDDKLENIESAARCGIDGYVFTGDVDQLKAALKRNEII
jgi:putative hydrolase of the HAD superfamily